MKLPIKVISMKKSTCDMVAMGKRMIC